LFIKFKKNAIEQRHPEDWSWKNYKSTYFIIRYDNFIWQRL